ncbi:MAG TPA: hypothetical protein VMZ91_13885 [Candidatus Paceibacterota bacterium]|nr:hypothetical protein [Candidatus Paceibacterota bacterium]
MAEWIKNMKGQTVGYVEENIFYTFRNLFGIMNSFCFSIDVIEQLHRLKVKSVCIKKRGINKIEIFECPFSFYTNTRKFNINQKNVGERMVSVDRMEKLSEKEAQIINTKFYKNC